jgi:signal transduction histidine kinase
LAWVVAQRLNRPLGDLAAVSRRLGDGDLTARASVHGIAETDAVAHALNQGAGRVEALVRAEREFSANASHQLRGPLTAISLRLEELAERDEPDVRASAGAALEQVDRLQAIITDLLALAAGGRAEPVALVDVADLARQRVQAWRRPYAQAGRPLVDRSAGACMAHASAAGVGQAIDALLDNALHHGGGEVSVTVRPTGRHVAIAVADQGSGVPPGQEQAIFDRHVSMAGGTGVGLALARTLIEADNGRIDLVQPRPAVFQILLAGSVPGDGATPTQVT